MASCVKWSVLHLIASHLLCGGLGPAWRESFLRVFPYITGEWRWRLSQTPRAGRRRNRHRQHRRLGTGRRRHRLVTHRLTHPGRVSRCRHPPARTSPRGRPRRQGSLTRVQEPPWFQTQGECSVTVQPRTNPHNRSILLFRLWRLHQGVCDRFPAACFAADRTYGIPHSMSLHV